MRAHHPNEDVAGLFKSSTINTTQRGVFSTVINHSVQSYRSVSGTHFVAGCDVTLPSSTAVEKLTPEEKARGGR